MPSESISCLLRAIVSNRFFSYSDRFELFAPACAASSTPASIANLNGTNSASAISDNGSGGVAKGKRFSFDSSVGISGDAGLEIGDDKRFSFDSSVGISGDAGLEIGDGERDGACAFCPAAFCFFHCSTRISLSSGVCASSRCVNASRPTASRGKEFMRCFSRGIATRPTSGYSPS
jgi:hypothetical protein